MTEETWAPPFKVNTQEITFDSDGVTLSATVWQRPKKAVEAPAEGKKPKKIKEGDAEAPPRAWCILVHGLLSDRREFGPLPAKLAEQGLGVLAFDMRGHGKSGGPRGVVDLEAAERDVKAAMAHLASHEQQWDLKPQQWAVIGHSLGAVAALRTGSWLHAGDVIVAVAPFRTIGEEINVVKRWGYALAFALSHKNGDESGPTLKYEVGYKDVYADKAAAKKAASEGFLQTRIPVRNYPRLMAIDGEAVARMVADPTVLVVASSKDTVVSNRASRKVYDAVASAKEWYLAKDVGHSLFMDGLGPAAVDRIVKWITYRLVDFNEVRAGHTKR